MPAASKSTMVFGGIGTSTLPIEAMLAGTLGISIGDTMPVQNSLRKKGFEKQLNLKEFLRRKENDFYRELPSSTVVGKDEG